MLSLQKETGVRLFVDPHPVNHSRAETVRWLRALPETRGMAEVERIPYCQTNVEIASLLAKISRITVREHGLAIVVC